MNRPLILLILIVVSSCSTLFKKKNERVLARVYDNYLYESELKGVVAAGTAAKDSLVLTRSFIDSWVRQKLILHQAQNNLTDSEMDFTKQLEDYKNSLTVYAYENTLVRQKLDTLVTEEETQNYYDANQQSFLLKDNIVQMQYVKLPMKSSIIKQMKKLMSSGDPDDKNRLAGLCEKHAEDYFLDSENWLLFNDVLKQVPIKTYNQEEFLKNHREFEYQDSMYVYLVRLKDFKIKESVSPLNLEKQRIRDIIRNKRKIDLIYRMQEAIYSEAQKKNVIEIY
ncbi:MAG: hypothetical protein Q8M08_03995 [Bacteroidales bacterium]|nr:hypothetical protein [Bacteroidales bacterium]